MAQWPLAFLSRTILGKHGILFLLFLSKINFILALVTAVLINKNATICNWDCYWYVSIIENGYQKTPNITPPIGAANWAFFPAMPLLVKLLQLIIAISPVILGILINTVSIYIALVYLEKIIGSDRKIARTTSGVILLSPLNVYVNTLYTEAIYFMLTVVLAYFLKKKAYLPSIVAAAFISGTRVTGLLISAFVSLAILNDARKKRITWWSAILASPICFLGAVIFSVFLKFRTGDLLAFLHIQKAWGTGEVSFLEWLMTALQFESPTLIAYLLLFIATITLTLYLFRRGELFEASLASIPVITTISTAAVNFRYFLVSYPAYIILSKSTPKWRVSKVTLLTIMALTSYILEICWLLRLGFMI